MRFRSDWMRESPQQGQNRSWPSIAGLYVFGLASSDCQSGGDTLHKAAVRRAACIELTGHAPLMGMP